ncbi:hypothetical protein SUGI_0072130 [Cryptomeria japonica]|nr:hypothetical protein SUGI_0072130 [Cryptomeria japonica]
MASMLANALCDDGIKLSTQTKSGDVFITLNPLEGYLGLVGQSPSNQLEKALVPTVPFPSQPKWLSHSYDDITIMVAICLSEIMRILARQVPYDDETMEEINESDVISQPLLSMLMAVQTNEWVVSSTAGELVKGVFSSCEGKLKPILKREEKKIEDEKFNSKNKENTLPKDGSVSILQDVSFDVHASIQAENESNEVVKPTTLIAQEVDTNSEIVNALPRNSESSFHSNDTGDFWFDFM